MEEERVVCEIPVYLSKALSKKLYLVQIPQRPATVPLDESELVETKIKPEQGKLQFTLGINPKSQYYDEYHGESLAEAAEGLGLNEDQYIPDARRRIDKSVLESSNPDLASTGRYVAGVIKDGAIHLTPLKSIVQMKPVLPYLNKADTAKAKHDAATTGGAGGGDTEDEIEEEATKVTVKFKRGGVEGNKGGSASKSSLAMRKMEEEEPWINLNYEGKNPLVYSQLCSQNVDNDAPMYVLTQKDYLEQMFPKYKEVVIDGSDRDPKTQFSHQRVNTIHMREMTLLDQLKILILNGKVMRYDQIIEFLKIRLRCNPDEVTLLRTLQTVAVLVQGCWVANSELVYPNEFKSNTNGVPGPIMQAARDTVLGIFTEERFVERKKISPLLHIPNEEVSEILSSVSRRVVKKGWEFLLPYDHSFIARHPEIANKQNIIWEKKNLHRSRRESENSTNRDPLKPPASKSPPRRRHSRTMSFSSDNESGSETGGGKQSSSGRQRRASKSRSDVGDDVNPGS